MRVWVGRLLRLTMVLGLLIVVSILGLVGRVEASDGMRGDRCVVETTAVITEDFYFFCRTLDVYGTIEGDLIGLAAEITIWPRSEVTGDLWVGGGKLDLSGKIGDDVHFGGIVVNVRDEASFAHDRVDLASVALDTNLETGSFLPGDLLVYGYQAHIDGRLGGDIDFTGEALVIGGIVEGNVDASVGDARRSTDLPALPFWDVAFSNPGLQMDEEARVAGDVRYRAASAVVFPPDTIDGELEFTLANQQLDITKAEQPNEAAHILVGYFRRVLKDIITLLIIGVLALRIAPRSIRQPAVHVRQRGISTVGWGLVTFMFSVPVAIVIVILGLFVLLILYVFRLTSLMVLVMMGLLVAGSGLLGGFYFLLYFMGRVVISFLIGQMLHRSVLHLPEWGQMRQWMFTLAIGSLIYTLLANIPIPAAGLVFELVTALAGGGAVIMTIRDIIIEIGLIPPRTDITPEISIGESIRVIAAPTEPARPEPPRFPSPGMANLPEGFTGFDEDW